MLSHLRRDKKVTNWITWHLSGKPAVFLTINPRPQNGSNVYNSSNAFSEEKEMKKKKAQQSESWSMAWLPRTSALFWYHHTRQFFSEKKTTTKHTQKLKMFVLPVLVLFKAPSWYTWWSQIYWRHAPSVGPRTWHWHASRSEEVGDGLHGREPLGSAIFGWAKASTKMIGKNNWQHVF